MAVYIKNLDIYLPYFMYKKKNNLQSKTSIYNFDILLKYHFVVYIYFILSSKIWLMSYIYISRLFIIIISSSDTSHPE